jgi:hypothetical protein
VACDLSRYERLVGGGGGGATHSSPVIEDFLTPVLPDSRLYGQMTKKWPYKKFGGHEKSAAGSGYKVAVKNLLKS